MAALKLRKIGAVLGPHKPEAIAAVRDLKGWSAERGIELCSTSAVAEQTPCGKLELSDGELAEDVDLIVVLGGDGTMLGAARLIGARRIPVLGINLGLLGYLTEFTQSEMFAALEGVLAGDFQIDERMRLDVTLDRRGTTIRLPRALNEAVITGGATARMIEFDCHLNEMFVNSFRADGMIVATPTGSTAYSLSAGGPIVHPNLAALVLTPICPHLLSNRPVVVPAESVVHLTFKRASDETMLTVDGQTVIDLQPEDRVVLRRSAVPFALLKPANRNYFEVLRTKLKWGLM
jgi:NAD+ kinase